MIASPATRSALLLLILQALCLPSRVSSDEQLGLETDTSSYSWQCFNDGSSVCEDNPEYVTHTGHFCEEIATTIDYAAGENCFHKWYDTSSALRETYDEGQVFELMWECPCACAVQCDADSRISLGGGSDVGDSRDGAGGETTASGPESWMDDPTNSLAPVFIDANINVDAKSGMSPALDQDGASGDSDSSTGIFSFIPSSLGLIALIVAASVGAIVLYISVMSVFHNFVVKRRNERKKREIENTGVFVADFQVENNDINSLVESDCGVKIIDISPVVSESTASFGSLDTYEKYRIYREWKNQYRAKGGDDGFIDGGDGVIEP